MWLCRRCEIETEGAAASGCGRPSHRLRVKVDGALTLELSSPCYQGGNSGSTGSRGQEVIQRPHSSHAPLRRRLVALNTGQPATAQASGPQARDQHPGGGVRAEGGGVSGSRVSRNRELGVSPASKVTACRSFRLRCACGSRKMQEPVRPGPRPSFSGALGVLQGSTATPLSEPPGRARLRRPSPTRRREG